MSISGCSECSSPPELSNLHETSQWLPSVLSKPDLSYLWALALAPPICFSWHLLSFNPAHSPSFRWKANASQTSPVGSSTPASATFLSQSMAQHIVLFIGHFHGASLQSYNGTRTDGLSSALQTDRCFISLRASYDVFPSPSPLSLGLLPRKPLLFHDVFCSVAHCIYKVVSVSLGGRLFTGFCSA